MKTDSILELTEGRNMDIGKIYDIEITDVSTKGEGIGRVDGAVAFVPGLIPGDRARVKIGSIKKNIARGSIEEITEPSADRCDAPCPEYGKCGGCQLQSMDYGAQLRLKERQLRDKLDRIYGGEYPEIESIVGMDDPWRYRDKAVYAMFAGAAKTEKDGSISNKGPLSLGFYDGADRRVIDCPDCMIQSDPANACAAALREYIESTGASVYDERSRKGRLRQMIVRTGFESHEVMVVLVINGKKLGNADLLANLLYDAIDRLNYTDEEWEKLLAAEEAAGDDGELPEIPGTAHEGAPYELRSLIVSFNSEKSLAVPSKDFEVLYGERIIHDSIGGVNFEISPFSFYQVNPPQMKKLYDTVVEFADFKGDEIVYDLYCGVGTIGIYCASHVKYVWGIEQNKAAVIDANRNAVINGLVNIRFLTGKSEERVFDLLSGDEEYRIPGDDTAGKTERPDVVIVDPPRAGCRPELLEAIMKCGPEKIVYVSCDPGTLCRDLKILTGMTPASSEAEESASDSGLSTYKINRIRQVDQFCHTTHVETVCLLTHRG